MADPSASGSSPRRRISWTARLLAPLALVVTLLAVALVVTTSMDGGDEAADEAAQQSTGVEAEPDKSDESDDEGSGGEKTYVVESGDSLSTIAEKFDTSVEELEKLNPDVDSTTLIEGQELKIR